MGSRLSNLREGCKARLETTQQFIANSRRASARLITGNKQASYYQAEAALEVLSNIKAVTDKEIIFSNTGAYRNADLIQALNDLKVDLSLERNQA